MTREKEIRELADKYRESYAMGFMSFNDIVESIIEWADEHPISPWISVEERLPEEDYTSDGRRKYYSKCVLVRYTITYDDSVDKPSVYYGTDQYFYTDHTWLKHNKREGIVTETITHWMPIPELPTTK